MAVDDHGIRGVLPLFLVSHWLFGRSLVSVPAANASGVLAADEEAEQQLMLAVQTLARDLDVAYVEFRQEDRSLPGLPEDLSHVTTIIPLVSDPETILRNAARKIRRDLNRAARDGLVVHRGNELLPDFYERYKTRMHQLGSPPYGQSFFRAICREFGESVDVIVVRQWGRNVAANLAIHHRDRIYNLFAGAEPAAMKSGAVTLFCWDQIQRGCLIGMKTYDFGRSTVGSSAHHYKSFWHGEDVALHYAYLLHRSGAIPDKRSTGPRYRLAASLWRKLPAPVVDRLGPRIMKYVF